MSTVIAVNSIQTLGMLGGGRSGKNTKYILEEIRGDHVGWFDGDPCHDASSGREETPVTEGKCWKGGSLQTFMRYGTLSSSSQAHLATNLTLPAHPFMRHGASISSRMVACAVENRCWGSFMLLA
jgi:hypothetical protein